MAEQPHSSMPGQPSPGVPGITTTTFDEAELGFMTSEQPDSDSELGTDSTLWAVVFAGGIGTRFWPLSTPLRPKPLLCLVGDRPLIADTLRRLQPLIPPERTLVLTSADIADAIRAGIVSPDLLATHAFDMFDQGKVDSANSTMVRAIRMNPRFASGPAWSLHRWSG